MKAFVSWTPHWKVYAVRAIGGPDDGRVILRASRVMMHHAEFIHDFTHPRYRGLQSRGVAGYIDVLDVTKQFRDISVTADDQQIPATWSYIVDVEQVGTMIRDGGTVKFDEDKNRYIRWRGLEYGVVDKADKVFLSPSMILDMNYGEKS